MVHNWTSSSSEFFAAQLCAARQFCNRLRLELSTDSLAEENPEGAAQESSNLRRLPVMKRFKNDQLLTGLGSAQDSRARGGTKRQQADERDQR